MKKVARIVFAVFFVLAGLNHFINPGFYLPLIPPYLPWHDFLNAASGVLEVLLGVGLFLPAYRKIAAWGIIILMVLFIPAHVHFIQIGSCVPDGLCAPAWVGWVRLVVIQPLLILWAWWVR